MKNRTPILTLAVIGLLAFLSRGAEPAPRPNLQPFAEGRFKPDDESLKQYRCPEWFRDAKLGIWAVWGPESVPMQGDWYARNLYLRDGVDKTGKPVGQSRHNKYHVEHYGHPSKFGFKDVIPLWKAEKWEPDQLMALYKRAGAKYFCMIAEHHDNFDCWNSKFNRWNSLKMGPKRDIAAEWKAAATKHGLRFGMTEHLAASWWFYGATKGIHPEPWQTDTCVAGWYYDEKVLERHGYKTPAQVIHMLCDIVSKNGNLLLNFPPRPDGTLDDDELKILDAMAAWITVNGEAIYGTRPWKVFGEGPAKLGKGRHGGLSDTGNYKASDIRFTQSKDGKQLYALALGWPEDGQIFVRSLASAAGEISDVALLGHPGKLDWQQTGDGLVVKMPSQKPCDLAHAFKISAGDLSPVPVVYDGSITPCADGRFVLPAADAEIHGDTPRYEHTATKDQIGCWAKAEDFVSWNIKLTKPGRFAVEVAYSCAVPGSVFTVEAGCQVIAGTSASTRSWETYRTDRLGTMTLDKPGSYTLAVRPQAGPKWRVIGLKAIVLRPVRNE